jgi:hypothetical protein
MLELGSIDVKAVQRDTRNTPLLMLAKVIERDGPEAVEVAGAAAVSRAVSIRPPHLPAAAMLSKGVSLSACDARGYDCFSVVLRRRLPQLQVPRGV